MCGACSCPHALPAGAHRRRAPVPFLCSPVWAGVLAAQEHPALPGHSRTCAPTEAAQAPSPLQARSPRQARRPHGSRGRRPLPLRTLPPAQEHLSGILPPALPVRRFPSAGPRSSARGRFNFSHLVCLCHRLPQQLPPIPLFTATPPEGDRPVGCIQRLSPHSLKLLN